MAFYKVSHTGSPSDWVLLTHNNKELRTALTPVVLLTQRAIYPMSAFTHCPVQDMPCPWMTLTCSRTVLRGILAPVGPPPQQESPAAVETTRHQGQWRPRG